MAGGGKSREREGSYVLGKESEGSVGPSYRTCMIEVGNWDILTTRP